MIVKLKCLTIIIFASANFAHAYDVIPEANISSYIGEPLKVEIATTGVSGYVKLATKADYSRFAIKYIGIPLSLKVDTANDEPKVVISSNAKINSPNFEVLIEVSDSGKSKFYTVPVMLDPKLESTRSGGQLIDFSEAQLPESISKNKVKIGYNPSGRTFGPIDNRDSLWNIASIAGTKGEQQKEMVEAIRILNPTAFVGAKLKVGAMLQIPDLTSKFSISDVVQVEKGRDGTGQKVPKTVVLGPNLGLNRLVSEQTEGDSNKEKPLVSTGNDSKGLELALENEDPRNLYVVKNIEDVKKVQPSIKSDPVVFSDIAEKPGAAIISDSPALTKEAIAIVNNASDLELEKNSDSFVIKQINENPIVPKSTVSTSNGDYSTDKPIKKGSDQLNLAGKTEQQGGSIVKFIMSNVALIIGLAVLFVFLLIFIKLSKVKQLAKSGSDKPKALNSSDKPSSDVIVKQNIHKETSEVETVKDDVKDRLIQQSAVRSENVESVTNNTYSPKVQNLQNIDAKAIAVEVQKEPYLYMEGEQDSQPNIENIESPVQLVQGVAPKAIDDAADNNQHELLKKQEYVIKYTHFAEEALSSIKRYLGYHASISESIVEVMQRRLLNRKNKLPSSLKNMQSYIFEYAHMAHDFGINADTQSLFLKTYGIPKPVKAMILFASDAVQKSVDSVDSVDSADSIDNLAADFVEETVIAEPEKAAPLNIEEIRVQANDKITQLFDIHSEVVIEGDSLGGSAIEANSESNSEAETTVNVQTDIQMPVEASNLELSLIEEQTFVETDKAELLNIEEITDQVNDQITQRFDIQPEMAIEDDQLEVTKIDSAVQTEQEIIVERQTFEVIAIDEELTLQSQIIEAEAEAESLEPSVIELDVADSAVPHAEILDSEVEEATVASVPEVISDTLTRELLDSELDIMLEEDFSLNGEDTLEQTQVSDLFEIESNIESELLLVEEESQDAAESYEAIGELVGEEIELEPEFITTAPTAIARVSEQVERESDSVKLELAEAYISIDPLKSLPLLKEILTDGSRRQKEKALELLNQLL